MNFLEKKRKEKAAKKAKKNSREIRRYINRIDRQIRKMNDTDKRTIVQMKSAMSKRDEVGFHNDIKST